LSILAYNVPM